MESNPWLSNSRWMKGSKDLKEQCECESGMSNSQKGECASSLKEMRTLRDELQGWKNKCAKMEVEFRTEKEKWKRVLIVKQNELIKMKGQLDKMTEDLEKAQLERDRLAKLIEGLKKLGMTGLTTELQRDKHMISANKSNIYSHDCSVSNSKGTGRLVDFRMAVKGKLEEMKSLSEVGLTGLSKKDDMSQCQINSVSLSKIDKVSQCQAGLSKKDKTSQFEIDHVNCKKKIKASEYGISGMNPCKKDEIFQCQIGLESLGKKDGMIDVQVQVEENLEEMKPHSEKMLPGVGENDKITGGCEILEDSQKRPHCTITTAAEDNSVGKSMLKRGFEDFDKWLYADKQREVRKASPRAKCFKMDKTRPSDNNLEAMVMKEEAKSEEDAEVVQEVGEEMEVQVRCKRSDGKQWRCGYPALSGRTLCHKHFSYAQLKPWKNKKARSSWGNAKKPKKSSTIAECKRLLTIVNRQEEKNKIKCWSDDEEECISDSSEEESPKKKRNPRVNDEEEKDPNYSPTMRRKQKYEKLESSPVGSVALNAGHENMKRGACCTDRLTPKWEQIDLVSRDGQMKLSTQVLFASFDQRSARAAGESACSVLVAVIADWLHNNRNSMLNKPLFEDLIRKGSLEWRNLCQIQAYEQKFPDGHFDLETVIEAKVCSLSLVADKSFVAFFQSEKLGDSFEYLQESTPFDKIWEEIMKGPYAKEDGCDEPQIYIVTWNDHFFLLKVEKEVCYLIDTLGERLFEGCNQAYILKFDKNRAVYQMGEEEKNSMKSQFASIEISKSSGNKLQLESPKIGNTGSIENAKNNNGKGKLFCKAKESCKEFIKGFWAALTLRELEIDIKMGLMGSIHPYQRLQIEFHFTCLTSLEGIAG